MAVPQQGLDILFANTAAPPPSPLPVVVGTGDASLITKFISRRPLNDLTPGCGWQGQGQQGIYGVLLDGGGRRRRGAGGGGSGAGGERVRHGKGCGGRAAQEELVLRGMARSARQLPRVR